MEATPIVLFYVPDLLVIFPDRSVGRKIPGLGGVGDRHFEPLVAVLVMIEPAISEILFTIAKGGAIAVLQIVFVLPGVLAALDRGKEPQSETAPADGSEAGPTV